MLIIYTNKGKERNAVSFPSPKSKTTPVDYSSLQFYLPLGTHEYKTYDASDGIISMFRTEENDNKSAVKK